MAKLEHIAERYDLPSSLSLVFMPSSCPSQSQGEVMRAVNSHRKRVPIDTVSQCVKGFINPEAHPACPQLKNT